MGLRGTHGPLEPGFDRTHPGTERELGSYLPAVACPRRAKWSARSVRAHAPFPRACPARYAAGPQKGGMGRGRLGPDEAGEAAL